MSDAPPAGVAIRTSRDRKVAEGWALVLTAVGIPSRLSRTGPDWQLEVRESDRERARVELESYDLESAAPEVPVPAREPYGNSAGGFIVAAGLLLFFSVTGPYDRAVPWHAEGAANARAIVGGELWRTVTALTLHADLAHVLANTASAAIFVSLVYHALGPGLGSWLLLGAGAGGNLINAWFQRSGYIAVGASTAPFGAVGILSGLQFAQRWGVRPAGSRPPVGPHRRPMPPARLVGEIESSRRARSDGDGLRPTVYLIRLM